MPNHLLGSEFFYKKDHCGSTLEEV